MGFDFKIQFKLISPNRMITQAWELIMRSLRAAPPHSSCLGFPMRFLIYFGCGLHHYETSHVRERSRSRPYSVFRAFRPALALQHPGTNNILFPLRIFLPISWFFFLFYTSWTLGAKLKNSHTNEITFWDNSSFFSHMCCLTRKNQWECHLVFSFRIFDLETTRILLVIPQSVKLDHVFCLAITYSFVSLLVP